MAKDSFVAEVTFKSSVLRALAKELFTLILKILQISNLETIKNCSFTKIDDYTN